ncbi:MAG: hypothetical protein RSC93_06805 [Erysipelotrichaceae bacterium]
MMKKILSFLLFLILIISSIFYMNSVVIDKSYNRYYMMREELETKKKESDVEIYGSCHAYTSFNPMKSNYNGQNKANPSEIIPVTYLHMVEQFKKSKPKVALVDIWGVMAYDTYIAKEEIFGYYLKFNLELLPLNKEKIEVINDIEELDILNDNFHLNRYKDRIINWKLSEIDFNYSFKKTREIYETAITSWLYDEMENRFNHNGYKSQPTITLEDYETLQNKINNQTQPVEDVMKKYINKIIELCEENDVELIFYRAPYISKISELKKTNYIADYLGNKKIPFYDLEKEIDFDKLEDFADYHHLSDTGANKATEFLDSKIEKLIE